jgi:cysteinyl-tRNA synthetase
LAHLANTTRPLTEKQKLQKTLYQSGQLLGFFQSSPTAWFQGDVGTTNIDQLIQQRQEARQKKDFTEADRIRSELLDLGIVLEDTAQGTTWRKI